MGQPTNPPLATGGGAAGSLQQPPVRYLTPQEQVAILASIGHPTWQIQGGAARPNTKIVTGDPAGPQMSTTDYSISVIDPTRPDRGGQDIVVAPGNKDAQGNDTWIPAAADPTKQAPGETKQNTVTIKTTAGVYAYDPNTKETTYLMPSDTPNLDEETTKAVDRQDREALRNEKEANASAGRGYQTTSDYQKMAAEAQRLGLSQNELNEKIRQFNATQGESKRQFDIGQAAKDKVDAQAIAKSKAEVTNLGANTANIGATTDRTRQEIEQSGKKFPGELDQQQATTESLKAKTASEKQAMQVAAAPTLQGGLTSPYLTTLNPLNGQIDQSQMNRAFQAKTPAEISARVGQIQAMAQAKNAEVMQKVSAGTLTHEQGLAEFNSWWNQQVEPQTASLKAAQEAAQFERAKDQADSQRQSYQTALGAGTQSINAFNAEAANRVGPNYESVINQIKSGAPLKNIDMTGAFTYKGPPVAEAAQQATQSAMQGMGGQLPAYAPVDIAGQLNRTNYMPAGMPPAPPQQAQQAPPPAPAMAAPGVDWYAEWQKRQAADVAAQQMQAGIQINPLDFTNYVPAA